MAKRSNRPFDDLDITKQELKQIGEAFKKKEFVELFAEYAKEVNDPKNKKIFESEIKQMEKERGHDITFLHPNPGYVIKTSADGCQKAFVNVCHDKNIGKPLASRCEKNGSSGLNWSVPYSHVKGRVDFDKKKNYCLFYDVVFHPDSIYLAKKNSQFKQLIEDTALSAVEDVNQVKLDRQNIKYPKASYKGPPQSSVIRKKIYSDSKKEPFHIPNYPYSDIQDIPKETTPRSARNNLHTTPNYILKQRKNVELEEYTYSPDARIHSAIPNELVIEIDLPLIKHAADVDLKIEGKSLNLITEKSAKYKLHIDLPYDVNDDNGNAKFDTDSKKLIVTLPVVRKKFIVTDFVKEDSGIETNRSSSEEDITKDIEIISSSPEAFLSQSDNESISKVIEIISPSEGLSLDSYRDEVQTIIKADRQYMFPPFTISHFKKELRIKFDIINVEPSTLEHRYIQKPDGLHMSFASFGSGCFPIHYAFFIHINGFSAQYLNLTAEVYDKTLLVLLKSDVVFDFLNYSTGLNPQCLKEFCYPTSSTEVDGLSSSWSCDEGLCDEVAKSQDSINEIVKASRNLRISQVIGNEIDSSLASKDENTEPLITRKKKMIKSRTLSESFEPSDHALGKRSILKKSRSLSESHSNDYNWSSLDSEDNNSKKTVRFSEVISKKIFRHNSSILGQKKKNEKKARNKKRSMERKRSESESEFSEYSEYSEMSDISASDLSSVSDISDASDDNSGLPPFIESAKQHRRRGSKNRRKNAATAKQNYILQDD